MVARHHTPLEAAVQRIRGEYLEMPGMRLTSDQLRRLSGLEAALCERVLSALVDAKFLHRTDDGCYVRWGD